MMRNYTKLSIFSILLFCKVLICWFIIYLVKCDSTDPIITFFGLESGDTLSYLEPFKNLHERGNYYFINDLGQFVYAGRLPIYGLLYYCLYPFISYSYIAATYVLVQLIFETLGLLALFQILRSQFKTSQMGFWLIIIIGALSTYQTIYSARLLPESLGISFFAILLNQVYFYRKTPSNNKVLIIGVLFLLIVGLKPYFGIMILPLIFEIWKKRKTMQVRKQLLILTAPFIVFCSAWTIRNFIQTHKIVPLTEKYSGYGISDSYLALRNYLGVLGENQEPWEPKAQGSFFFKRKTFYTVNDLYTDSYITKDSLLEVKSYFTDKDNTIPDSIITSKLNRYTEHYISTHPFYRISSFFSLTKLFLFHSGSYALYISKSSSCYQSWQWLFKIGQSLIYYILLIGFLIGIFLWRDWLLYFYPLFLIFFFCAVLQTIELRFFYQAFPCLLLGLGATFCSIDKRYNSKRKTVFKK